MGANDKRDEVTIDKWQPQMPAQPPRGHVLKASVGSYSMLGFNADLFVSDTADIVLQAVIERGPKTVDGDIIVAVYPAWREIAAMLERDPSAMFQIDPRKWEEIIAGAYKAAGFDEVILTPRSGDLGRDVIAVKKGLWTVRFIDQVKAYRPGHLVPADHVCALVGVLQMDHQASKGLVTTTSDFAPKIATHRSIAPLIPHRLELVNGQQLLKKLSDIGKGEKF